MNDLSRKKDIKLRIVPITFKEACLFIEKHHRHHKPTVGHKFSIGCMAGDDLCGVAVCGRPVSRYLDNGLTLEVNRVCTDGTRNACSKLYGACCRIAKNMGYTKIITYTLKSENGASLRASNFENDGQAGGKNWTGTRTNGGSPNEMKTRWLRKL